MSVAQGTELEIIQPDDWHLHLRDHEVMVSVLAHTAQRFSRAIVMPNLNPPLTTVQAVESYHQRILEAVPSSYNFSPLMTLYLCEDTRKEEINKAKDSGIIYGVKLYPAGATTHSSLGVRELEKVYPVFSQMEKLDLPLLVHAEVTSPEVDVFEREKVFMERHLVKIIETFPNLRVVFEHISTAEAVNFVKAASNRVAATITAHHLLFSRNAIFDNGLRPHYYCLPLLKTEADRQALVQAATGGDAKFFLGSDSAPHPQSAKQSACGCAGIYTAHCALELYAEVFDHCDALGCLEGFASQHGPAFYGLSPNTTTIKLVKKTQAIPLSYPLGEETLIPLRAGQSILWSLV